MKVQEDYSAFDETVNELADGVYVVPLSTKKVRLAELREYCREHRRVYEDLTDEEIEYFTVTNPIQVAL